MNEDVRERVRRIEIPWNSCGVDPYGISEEYLTRFLTMAGWLYHHYFTVSVSGLHHVPSRGRAMLVGNHSGGVAVDALMVVCSMFFDMDPPRLAQGMAEKFINRLPFAAHWTSRTGQFTGLPEHALRLLHDERLLMVFPEGARGTAKLYRERYSFVRFGTGFVRLAMQARTPIIPFGFAGGGEAIPTIMNSRALGKLLGAPYVPVTPYLLAFPLPVRLGIEYGEPILFHGTGTEDDDVIAGHVDQVRDKIAQLVEMAQKRRERGKRTGTQP